MSRSAAEVSVTLKNEGDEAYRPELFGSSITITRRFTKQGSSSFKIRNHKGATVGTKRADLDAIIDCVGIQVDNPLNILTQGMNSTSCYLYCMLTRSDRPLEVVVSRISEPLIRLTLI